MKKRATKTTSSPMRIVLTGGPGAGKTMALNEIKKRLGRQTIISPEAATLLYAGGFPRFSDSAAVIAAQTAIYHVQKNLEEVFASQNRIRVIFCDRGTIDGAAYWPHGESHFFRSMKTTLKKELLRYDAVLFLQTSALSIQEARSGNAYRTESKSEAVLLDRKLKNLWEKHPRFLYVPRQDTLEEKLAVAVSHLESLLS